jgi:hypothetical protein
VARRLIALGLVVLLALGAGWWWMDRRAKQAERQLGLDAARTLSESFAKARQLKVATLSGEVLATGSDRGFMGLLPSSQTIKYPYAVDYFVDLGALDRSAWRWDAATRTMTVRLPDVAPGRPSIDASRASFVGTTGAFMSRGASQRLSTQVAGRATLRAQETAKKPEHLTRARASAREAVAGLVEAPLAAAGLGEVTVVVRFPWEGQGAGVPVPWDTSRSLPEVYNAS